MSSGTSTVTGLASGVDWETTIQQLLAIEKRPQQLLQSRQTDNNTKLSLWAQIQTKIQALQSAMEGMDQASEFAVKSVSSSDSSLVAVTASAAAAEGAHTVQVLQLARAHTTAAQGWADRNTTGVGDSGGDLTIQVGSNTITIADADLSSSTTLEQLRDLINNASDNTGLVTASILDDGSGSNHYRLVLTANDTGTANVISVSSNPTNLNFATTAIDSAETQTGWSGTSAVASAGNYAGTTNKTFAFTVGGTGAQTVGGGAITINWVDSVGNTGSFQLAGGYTPGTAIDVAEGVQVSFGAGDLVGGQKFNVDVYNPTLVQAQDAQVCIDGIYMYKPTNSITDVIEGLTLDLLSSDPATTVNVSVTPDKAAVKSKIQDFISAYNTLMGDLKNYSSYDDQNKVAAPLLGDGFLSDVESGVTDIISQALGGLPANAQFTNLASVGIKSSSGGQLVMDTTRLDAALQDHFDDVVNLFSQSFATGDSKVSFISADAHTQAGQFALVVNYDVSGTITSATIDGQAAVIDNGTIHGAAGTHAEGLTLMFTPPEGGAGTVSTTVRYGKGLAATLAAEAQQINDPDTGPVHFATQSLNDTNDSLDRQISMWDDRLALIEERLRHQFSQLETLISQMKNQSSYLTAVLG
jgi:flagellar hook-associated protein 2